MGIGFAMGSADVVPGVSGGTIAFISGIYEDLLNSIKSLSGNTLNLFIKGKIKQGFQSIPYSFLVPLGLGIGSAILLFAKLISYLLTNYPIFVWSFFFGLVLASIAIVTKKIGNWSLINVSSFFISAVLAYQLVGLVPVETNESLWLFFLSGMLAICAMILPGISGSFILLLIGKYQQVLSAVTNQEIVKLIVFGLGCVVGLSLFSRILSWLLAKHHDLTIAILIGFMAGSLRKIWPWKETLTTRINSHGVEVPLLERNYLPDQVDISVILAVLLALVGVGIIFGINRFQKVHSSSSCSSES